MPCPDQHPIHQHWSLLGAWYRLADALCIALGLTDLHPPRTDHDRRPLRDRRRRGDHRLLPAGRDGADVPQLARRVGASGGPGHAGLLGLHLDDALGVGLPHQAHRRVLADFDADVVRRHAGADDCRPDRHPLRSNARCARWATTPGRSPSWASTSWGSSWRGTSRSRRRWG